ncbi:MAG: sodium/solute symporter [Candidatus Glassbacteria bacterium]|nr:sodium/solute symporter [Candidatus Glassbacteria bacterium]
MSEMEGLTRVDYLVVVAYMVIMITVGVLMSRWNKDADDYFKGGNKLPYWLAGLSLFMTSFSSWTFTGGAGKTYESGISIFSMYWGAVLGLGFGYFVFARRWRRTRSMTILEYLSERFDFNVHQFISWANTPITIFQCAIWLYALSIFLSAATHIPVTWVIFGCGIIILAYTMIGGLWGVCITDSLQFFILLPIAILVTILSVNMVGGLDALVANAPPKYWLPFNEEADITKMFVVFQFINGFFMFNSGGGAQRYFSAIDEREASKIAGLSAILCFIGPFIWLTPAMACRVLFPDLGQDVAEAFGLTKPSEAAYVFISMKVLPQGLRGVLIAGILAATMSSLSTFYNMYSAVITKDIICTVFIKDASKKFMHRLGMVVTLVMGLVSIMIAYFYSTLPDLGVFDLMFKVASVLGIPVAVPVILGLVYKRTPNWVPYTVILVGMAVGGVFAIWNWEKHLGYELFQAVQYPLLCALFFIPGMFFADEFGGSARIRFWGKALIYLLGIWYFLYGMFLYFNLPRIDGAVDAGSLAWVQQVIFSAYSSPKTLIVLAVAWAMMTEVVSRLKIVPGKLYMTEVARFFRKMDRPVDVAAELGEGHEHAEADLSSFKILGVVMVLIAAMMGLFFLGELTTSERWITFWALLSNLVIGIGLYWLGSYRYRKFGRMSAA